MSLWRHRTQIERAVAGELSGADEARLREHLAGCAECRRHYDTLSMQARILAGDPHGAGAERELARLIHALAPEKKVEKRRLGWLVPIGVLSLLAVFVGSQFGHEETIEYRGVDGSVLPALSFFVVTAPRDGGPLQRDLSFPGPTGTVRSDDWVAFAVNRNPVREATHFRGVLVNARGETVVLSSGKSVALDPGAWRVFGVVSGEPLDDAALGAAAKRAGIDGTQLTDLKVPLLQSTGVFTVVQ